jgi:hypothetical protein
MPRASDRARQISQETLCEITGVEPSTRSQWVRLRRLRKRGRGACEEFDAVELAVLKALMDGLRTSHAPIAWKQVRSQLPGAFEHNPLALLFDTQDLEATLVTELAQLARRAPYGHDVRVVALSERIRSVRTAFGRATDRH